MKKAVVGFLFACVVALTSCVKGVDEVAKQEENDRLIKEYMLANALVPTKDTIGIYGVIRDFNPVGRKLNFGDSLRINFEVFLLDGTRVASNESGKPAEFLHGFTPLYGLHLALTWMRVGERATMLLPYYAAYGTGGSTDGKVPGYAPVRLEVQLVSSKTEVDQINEYLTRKNYTPDITTQDNLNMMWLTRVAEGDSLGMGKTVSIAYKGWLLNDKKFDEGALTHLTGATDIIKGFDQAVRKMKVGEKAMVVFPSSLGYGSRTDRQNIPPFAPLAFEIEVTERK